MHSPACQPLLGKLISQRSNGPTPVGPAPLWWQPCRLAGEWYTHAVALLIARHASFPRHHDDRLANGGTARLYAYRFDQARLLETEQHGQAEGAVHQGRFRRMVIHRFPSHSLAWQQCSRIPRRLGKEPHQFALSNVAGPVQTGHREQAEHSRAENTLATDIGVVDAHRQARPDLNARVPEEARSSGHDPLLRREWLPLFA